MSVYEANINTAMANASYFSNDLINDIALSATDASQRILIGAHTAQNAGMLIGSSNISFSVRGDTSASTFKWLVNNATEAMTLLGTGNLGIGRTSPSYKLDVLGATRIGVTGTTTSLHIGDSTYTSATYPRFISALDSTLAAGAQQSLLFGKSGTSYNSGEIWYKHVGDGSANNKIYMGLFGNGSVINILGGGNVGISTTTPSYKLHVVGDICASSDIIAYSDARFKDELQVIQDAFNKVIQLTGYTFKVRDSKTNEYDPKRHTGVLAQDVEKVLPEAISRDDNDILGVAYGNMAGLFIEAIKEVNAKIDALRTDFETYKKSM